MGNTHTYNVKKVKCAMGSHVVSGFADDSIIAIESAGDGTTMKVGCDGEVVRSISPNEAYTIKISLLQSSPTNEYLRTRFEMDQAEGDGTFPIIIKDLMGKEQFSADVAWVSKMAPWNRGKESGNREWELACGYGKFKDE